MNIHSQMHAVYSEMTAIRNNIAFDQSRVPLERTAFHRHIREHRRSLTRNS